jgi:hypothetical protein
MRTPIAIAFAILAALYSAAPATGAPDLPKSAQRSDPEDVDGRLDIVRTRIRVGERRVRLVLETAEGWRCSYVKDDGSNAEGAAALYEDGKGVFLFWEFDTNKNRRFETDAFVRCKSGELRLVSDGLHREVRARKTDRRTVTASVSRKKWDLMGRRLQVRATSQVNGTNGTDVFVEQRDGTARLRPFAR